VPGYTGRGGPLSIVRACLDISTDADAMCEPSARRRRLRGLPETTHRFPESDPQRSTASSDPGTATDFVRQYRKTRLADHYLIAAGGEGFRE